VRLGLFGLPGAGKGTQAERIAKALLIPHISTGDMFREMQKGSSALAHRIRDTLAKGELVSDEMVTSIALERLGRPDCKNGFILDGYPRTLNQAKTLESSAFSLDTLLVIDVARSEILRRLSGRRVCEYCKSVFGEQDYQAEVCPNDGHPLRQRADDMPEAVSIRLELFERNFLPVLEFYEKLGRLRHVDGLGSTEVVFNRISRVIDEVGDKVKNDK